MCFCRPHLKCNNTWRIGPFAAPCYDVPWSQRKILGTLTFPNGRVFPLREGDMPNRNPIVPDDFSEREDSSEMAVRAGERRSRKEERGSCGLLRKQGIDLREYDIAEREWLWPNETRPNPTNASTGLKDLRALDHWVNTIETNASRNMPPGGWPLEFEGVKPKEWEALVGAEEPPSSSSSSSHIYDYCRSALLEEYGQRAVPQILKFDKLVNYSGKEPPLPEPAKEPGMLVPRFLPDGELDAFTPWSPDDIDEPLEGLDAERLHEKLWQYARDGRSNGTRQVLADED